jgi:hypothetical protein
MFLMLGDQSYLTKRFVLSHPKHSASLQEQFAKQTGLGRPKLSDKMVCVLAIQNSFRLSKTAVCEANRTQAKALPIVA